MFSVSGKKLPALFFQALKRSKDMQNGIDSRLGTVYNEKAV